MKDRGDPQVDPARSGGFLYAMPDAQPDQSDHREWQESDLEFLGAFVRGLVRDGSADPRRIYLAGFSLGGFLALEYTCAQDFIRRDARRKQGGSR